jgi:hypothetical protein
MNDPRNTDPQYLASMGYNYDPRTGAYQPGGTDNPGYASDQPGGVVDQFGGPMQGGFTGGVGGGGGSYFHGGASAGMPHGATPVAGAFYNLGASGPVNLSSISGPMSAEWARRMMRGQYMSPQAFGALQHAMPGYKPGMPSGIPGGYNQYIQNMRNLTDVFRTRGYVFPPSAATS